MTKKLPTKQSTGTVDNSIARHFANKKPRHHRLTAMGDEIPQGKPLTVPYRLPSMEQRVHNLERLGIARANAVYDTYSDDDDFHDHLDDLPSEGLSPYEDPSYYGAKKPTPKKAPQTPPKGDKPTAGTDPADVSPPPTQGSGGDLNGDD